MTNTINKNVDNIKHACARIVAILHIESFVTFSFDPSLISRMISDSDLNTTIGHKLVDYWAQNRINEIPDWDKQKKKLYAFFFAGPRSAIGRAPDSGIFEWCLR